MLRLVKLPGVARAKVPEFGCPAADPSMRTLGPVYEASWKLTAGLEALVKLPETGSPPGDCSPAPFSNRTQLFGTSKALEVPTEAVLPSESAQMTSWLKPVTAIGACVVAAGVTVIDVGAAKVYCCGAGAEVSPAAVVTVTFTVPIGSKGVKTMM